MADRNIIGNGRVTDTKLDSLKVSGSCVVENDIELDEAKIAGATSFKGNVDADTIKIAGSCEFCQNVKCDELKIAGSAKVYGNVEAEDCSISGILNVTGDFNADNIYIACVNSTFNNIYGDNLECELNAEHNKNHHNVANEIEVTKLTITNFIVKRISADRIKIGENCEIDVVEFKDSLEISKDAKIKKIIKL